MLPSRKKFNYICIVFGTNIWFLMELYGTYLSYLISRKLKETGKTLSVKEIALIINIYPTQREQYNFERRVRARLSDLVRRKKVVLQPFQMEQKNIFVTKYKSV